jgi:hypothetical protein
MRTRRGRVGRVGREETQEREESEEREERRRASLAADIGSGTFHARVSRISLPVIPSLSRDLSHVVADELM